MIIEITKLHLDGTRYRGEESASVFSSEDQHFVRLEGPLKYDLFVQLVSQRLVVQGSVSAKLEMECIRCMGFFSTTVQDSSFLRAYEIAEDTEYVDVTEDLREAALLQFPSFPVCREACRGLCPQCGKDLNQGSCACKKPDAINLWKALDILDIHDDENGGE